MQSKSYLTAISRTTLPKPTRWLIKQGLIQLPCFDYGCGKCYKINPPLWINYDPYYRKINPDHFRGSNMTVICNYVLCVLPESERLPILRHIQTLLSPGGIAYISVRNDKPRQGWGVSKRGTYQGRVQGLSLPIVYQCAGFRVYKLERSTVF